MLKPCVHGFQQRDQWDGRPSQAIPSVVPAGVVHSAERARTKAAEIDRQTETDTDTDTDTDGRMDGWMDGWIGR